VFTLAFAVLYPSESTFFEASKLSNKAVIIITILLASQITSISLAHDHE
jgi:hypothetical protein